ncbi:hypothetical protein HanRHA438_Chr07g0308661 [Helianthus annuus]|nr:hypothetical protein HanIR_Chr07g0322091 [Helianthus annuus]KAJ0908284.1 hypothetical protein HanRHA438_Chr07g0308661 [Helianthus annuus]
MHPHHHLSIPFSYKSTTPHLKPQHSNPQNPKPLSSTTPFPDRHKCTFTVIYIKVTSNNPLPSITIYHRRFTIHWGEIIPTYS